jgi:hypothetical protein
MRDIKKKSAVFEISSETFSEKFTSHLVVAVYSVCDWSAKWLCNSWKLCVFCGTGSIGQVGRAGEPLQKAAFF